MFFFLNLIKHGSITAIRCFGLHAYVCVSVLPCPCNPTAMDFLCLGVHFVYHLFIQVFSLYIVFKDV